MNFFKINSKILREKTAIGSGWLLSQSQRIDDDVAVIDAMVT